MGETMAPDEKLVKKARRPVSGGAPFIPDDSPPA
jgi:hypothetical protein